MILDFGFWILDWRKPACYCLVPQSSHNSTDPSDLSYRTSRHRHRLFSQSAIPDFGPIQNPKSKIQNREGFVLVCVLWVLAILTVISVGFGRRAMLDRQAAAYEMDHTEAMYMARGAVMRGIVELQNKAVYDLIRQQAGRASYAQHWGQHINLLKDKELFAEAGDPDFDKDTCEYVIRDECGLISINTASEDLLSACGLKRPVLRKIMVRRMGGLDDEGLGGGAGGGGQPQPPQAFQTVEEIRAFKGITNKEWFGSDKHPPLKDILTAIATPDGKINVNTAPLEVLKVIPDLGEGNAEAIARYRAGPDGELGTEDDQDFMDLGELVGKTGISGGAITALQTFCTTNSNLFTITGIATRRQGKVRASCVATVGIAGAHAGIIKWREELLES